MGPDTGSAGIVAPAAAAVSRQGEVGNRSRTACVSMPLASQALLHELAAGHCTHAEEMRCQGRCSRLAPADAAATLCCHCARAGHQRGRWGRSVIAAAAEYDKIHHSPSGLEHGHPAAPEW